MSSLFDVPSLIRIIGYVIIGYGIGKAFTFAISDAGWLDGLWVAIFIAEGAVLVKMANKHDRLNRIKDERMRVNDL